MRLLTIISGVMLVLTGLFCFANPGETFLSLAFLLGLAMILSSLISGISYWWGRASRKDNNGWIFAEAIITFILGILVLTSQIAADAAIPMVFGMWVMFSGVLRVVVATMINPVRKKSNFISTLIIGLLCAVGGVYAFLNPIIANLPIAVLLGMMFMLQGIGMLELGIHMPHEKKEKKPAAKRIMIQITKPVTSMIHPKKKKKNDIAIEEIKQALEVDSEVELTDEVVEGWENAETAKEIESSADDTEDVPEITEADAENITEEQTNDSDSEVEAEAHVEVSEIMSGLNKQ